MKTEIEVAYDDAIDASNELGFACMSAGEVIRHQADELVQLRASFKTLLADAYEWGYGDGQNNPNGYSSKKDRDDCIDQLYAKAGKPDGN